MKADLEHKLKDGYGFKFKIDDLNIYTEDKVAVKLSEDVLYLNGSQSEKTNQKLHKQSWFTQNQLNSMLKDQYQKPDFLRDIAVILRDKGDMENAYKLISKALELRPQGPVIQKLKKEIGELL
jgi:TfoX/Sxy family transcriptional regulator of competence genes